MVKHIKEPSIIKAAGIGNKIIKEYFGRVNSDTNDVSIAKMESPQGWIEPVQIPLFDEYTLVLKGKLKITTKDQEFIVNENEAILTSMMESVQYSTPFEGGAEYVAICLPAFSPNLVNRKE